MPSDRNDPSSERTSPEGPSYRALLPEGGAFDVRFNEGERTLTLRPVSEADEASAPSQTIPYRFERMSDGHALLMLDGRSIPVVITEASEDEVHVTIGGRTVTVHVQDETDLLLERFGIAAGAGAGEAEVRAPMPGLVVRVMIEEGQEVQEGDGLLVLEAMKMENELHAPAAGTVKALHAEEGTSADKDEVLVEIE